MNQTTKVSLLFAALAGAVGLAGCNQAPPPPANVTVTAPAPAPTPDPVVVHDRVEVPVAVPVPVPAPQAEHREETRRVERTEEIRKDDGTRTRETVTVEKKRD